MVLRNFFEYRDEQRPVDVPGHSDDLQFDLHSVACLPTVVCLHLQKRQEVLPVLPRPETLDLGDFDGKWSYRNSLAPIDHRQHSDQGHGGARDLEVHSALFDLLDVLLSGLQKLNFQPQVYALDHHRLFSAVKHFDDTLRDRHLREAHVCPRLQQDSLYGSTHDQAEASSHFYESFLLWACVPHFKNTEASF